MSLFKQHYMLDASLMDGKSPYFYLVFISARDFGTIEVRVGNLKVISYYLSPRDCRAGVLFNEYRYKIK